MYMYIFGVLHVIPMSLLQKISTTHFEWLEKMFSESETLAKQQWLLHLAGFGVRNRNKINATEVSVIKKWYRTQRSISD